MQRECDTHSKADRGKGKLIMRVMGELLYVINKVPLFQLVLYLLMVTALQCRCILSIGGGVDYGHS